MPSVKERTLGDKKTLGNEHSLPSVEQLTLGKVEHDTRRNRTLGEKSRRALGKQITHGEKTRAVRVRLSAPLTVDRQLFAECPGTVDCRTCFPSASLRHSGNIPFFVECQPWHSAKLPLFAECRALSKAL